MTASETERNFLWQDYDNTIGKDNLSCKGIINAINYAFFNPNYINGSVSLSHTPLDQELGKVVKYSAIKNDLYTEEILDLIAEELGLPGWQYVGQYNVTTTVRDRKNDVLKRAHELMRYRGTPYAVKRILDTFGYTNVSIEENVSISLLYDGTFDYDATINYEGNLEHQLFNVSLTSVSNITSGADTDQQNAIIELINFYKKERLELYRLIIKEPANPAGATVQVW